MGVIGDNMNLFAGIITEEFFTEQEMQKASLQKPTNFVGIVFKDSMSYHLRFLPNVIPLSASYVESRGKNICVYGLRT